MNEIPMTSPFSFVTDLLKKYKTKTKRNKMQQKELKIVSQVDSLYGIG